ncbi:hypothetical protein CLOM_g17665 [Closterium sp. NIES-68]|nr:hypothetical protein CLOM_g17665 [Closterium sp. NIES-68]
MGGWRNARRLTSARRAKREFSKCAQPPGKGRRAEGATRAWTPAQLQRGQLRGRKGEAGRGGGQAGGGADMGEMTDRTARVSAGASPGASAGASAGAAASPEPPSRPAAARVAARTAAREADDAENRYGNGIPDHLLAAGGLGGGLGGEGRVGFNGLARKLAMKAAIFKTQAWPNPKQKEGLRFGLKHSRFAAGAAGAAGSGSGAATASPAAASTAAGTTAVASTAPAAAATAAATAAPTAAATAAPVASAAATAAATASAASPFVRPRPGPLAAATTRSPEPTSGPVSGPMSPGPTAVAVPLSPKPRFPGQSEVRVSKGRKKMEREIARLLAREDNASREHSMERRGGSMERGDGLGIGASAREREGSRRSSIGDGQWASIPYQFPSSRSLDPNDPSSPSVNRTNFSFSSISGASSPPPAAAAGEEFQMLDIDNLINHMRYGPPEEKAAAAALLRVMTRHGFTCGRRILEAGGVAPLVELLWSGDEATAEHAATSLLNLALEASARMRIVVTTGSRVVEGLVHVLSAGAPAARANAAAALFLLSRDTGANSSINSGARAAAEANSFREAVVTAGALQPLLDLLLDGPTRARKTRPTS